MSPRAGSPRPLLDPEARAQLRETRATICEALREEPDDFKALVLADVIEELEPGVEPELVAHRKRFRACRSQGWTLRARELGLDRLLFHLAGGWRDAGIGLAAVPLLERRAARIGAARPPGVPRGQIDESYVPATLTSDARAKVEYYPDGHLARVSIAIDRLHDGELALEQLPGRGRFTLVEKRGGYGTMTSERYRDGAVVTTLNTPWHDGVESRERRPWTRWVEENLAALERLSRAHPAGRKRRSATPRR